ncbi:class I SAM-dependent methyltransferase [Sphingomonas radiodurans]|uniref:class I SAM-dependent methyltransferase n=1 Tax=Sphingomonas radiodurans TaxID=2890321 RepID=UPI001E589C07|nr:class I SAM-dependent methyltransferase [Sphingomonas radiodurans]WBH17017.1 class I SAM-dependent methyltransferase [Sphingomonas radiodurans]
MAKGTAEPADLTFVLDGVTFLFDRAHGSERPRSDERRFVLCKSDQQIECYRTLTKYRPRDVLEIGLYEGGSLVLWDKLFAPRCLVGVDRRRQPVAALEAYRAERPHIRTYYGRGQDKPGTVMAARENFPTGVDLAIDDASHLYAETKATFAAIFPLVRPGGFYVIENWAWAHRPNAQSAAHAWHEQPALTNFVFELTVLAAASPAIQSVHVDAGLVAVRKGNGALPVTGLAVEQLLRGRALGEI